MSIIYIALCSALALPSLGNSKETKVVVRALARDAKFIGTSNSNG